MKQIVSRKNGRGWNESAKIFCVTNNVLFLLITCWALPYISYVSKLTFIDIELCYTPSVIVVLSTTGLLNWSSIIHNKMPVENWLSELEEEG